jgi:hypothetical protein
MTRQEQSALIINSISEDLKDKPDIQAIITSKFNAWFKQLLQQGQELLMQGQVAVTSPQAEEAPEGGAVPAPEGA